MFPSNNRNSDLLQNCQSQSRRAGFNPPTHGRRANTLWTNPHGTKAAGRLASPDRPHGLAIWLSLALCWSGRKHGSHKVHLHFRRIAIPRSDIARKCASEVCSEHVATTHLNCSECRLLGRRRFMDRNPDHDQSHAKNVDEARYLPQHDHADDCRCSGQQSEQKRIAGTG